MSLVDPLSEKVKRVDWQFIAFCVLAFMFWYFWPTEGAERPVSLTIYPHVVLASPFQRAYVRVEWHIAKHPDNRSWEFAYEADNGDYSSSMASMDERSPTLFPICITRMERACYRAVAPGTYHFKACVSRTTKTYCDYFTLTVGGGN